MQIIEALQLFPYYEYYKDNDRIIPKDENSSSYTVLSISFPHILYFEQRDYNCHRSNCYLPMTFEKKFSAVHPTVFCFCMRIRSVSYKTDGIRTMTFLYLSSFLQSRMHMGKIEKVLLKVIQLWNSMVNGVHLGTLLDENSKKKSNTNRKELSPGVHITWMKTKRITLNISLTIAKQMSTTELLDCSSSVWTGALNFDQKTNQKSYVFDIYLHIHFLRYFSSIVIGIPLTGNTITANSIR